PCPFGLPRVRIRCCPLLSSSRSSRARYFQPYLGFSSAPPRAGSTSERSPLLLLRPSEKPDRPNCRLRQLILLRLFFSLVFPLVTSCVDCCLLVLPRTKQSLGCKCKYYLQYVFHYTA